ncbi:MAG TPA: hypothetical protein VME40_01945 [Caulobacteraceae bacterium]|nr:hypothetical protein [Caulobacteraceae bacterium]
MSRNRWRGAGRKFTGELKQAAGRISGSRRLQIEGAMDRLAGGAQAALGRLQDRLMGDGRGHRTPHNGSLASRVPHSPENV